MAQEFGTTLARGKRFFSSPQRKPRRTETIRKSRVSLEGIIKIDLKLDGRVLI
jgi:hypothetical protein